MKDTVAIALPQSRFRRAKLLRTTVRDQERSMPQFSRKFYHFANGMLCAALYALVLTREQALLMLGTVGGILIVADIARLRFPTVNTVALQLFGRLMRREELRSISGNSFYIVGLFLIVLFFPKQIVLYSVLFLAIGDPAAAVTGTLYGRHKIFGKKSWEGAAANFVCSGLAASLLALGYFKLPLGNAIVVFFVGGLASTIAELCPLDIDDNFTIPLISAVLLSLAGAVIPLY